MMKKSIDKVKIVILLFFVFLNHPNAWPAGYSGELHKKFFASLVRGDLKTVKECLDLGVNVNVYEDETSKFTPLHKAAMWNHTLVIQELLKRRPGIKVNERDAWGFTPLMYACKWLNADVIKALLMAGANVHMRNKVGQAPLHLVVLNESMSWDVSDDMDKNKKISKIKKALKLLIAVGAFIRCSKNCNGKSAYALGSEELGKHMKNLKDHYGQCSICYESYLVDCSDCFLVSCEHKFHTECITNWFVNQKKQYKPYSCPLCRDEPEIMITIEDGEMCEWD